MSPDVPVLVELNPELGFLADPADPASEQLKLRMSGDLSALLEELGIPGRPTIQIRRSENTKLPRFFFHNVLQRYPFDLLETLAKYLSPEDVPVASALPWATEKPALPKEGLLDLVAQLLLEVAKARPEELLTIDQARVYFTSSDGATSATPDLATSGGYAVLTYLLKLRLSLVDSPVVVKHVRENSGGPQNPHEIAERLVPSLLPKTIEIQMMPDYVEELIGLKLRDGQHISVTDPRVGDRVREHFQTGADQLFDELGMRVPDITFVASRTIKPHCFAIKVNNIADCPRRGLPHGRLLVNATPAQLADIKPAPRAKGRSAQVADQVLHIFKRRTEDSTDESTTVDPPQAATNPANDVECSIIDESYREEVEAKRFYVWNPLGYVGLSLSRVLRRNAWRLIQTETVEYELALTHQAVRGLVLTTLDKISLEQLTEILRLLLSEEVSIRNLRSILERIVSYDFVVTDPSRFIVFDDRLALRKAPSEGPTPSLHHAQHVRAGLRQYLTHKLTRGQNTLIVYLLDPRIEQRISAHLSVEGGDKEETRLAANEFEDILAAVRKEINPSARPAPSPVILTLSDVRRFIRDLVNPEFPNLFVSSYDELSPDSNIQPIARISLS